MLKLWENAKVSLYFEDAENEKYVGHTISQVKEDPTEEELVKFANAVDALSDLPMDHFKVIQTQRYVL